MKGAKEMRKNSPQSRGILADAKEFWGRRSLKQKIMLAMASTLAFLMMLGGLAGGSNNTHETSAKPTETSQDSISSSPTPEETTQTPTSTPGTSTNKEETLALADEKDIQVVPDSVTAGAPEFQAALATLETLEVKGRGPKTQYNREKFGKPWEDTDRNGCDTRNDILRRDLSNITVKAGTHGCKVMSGTLADPYTGKTVEFEQGKDTSKEVQIDHVVSLSDAWQTGAISMNIDTRTLFANDPENLLAVNGNTNQQKGDGDAATWLPPNTGYRCTYVAKQIHVKAKYGLWVKPAEKEAMKKVLAQCGATEAPTAEPPAPVEQAPVVEQPPAAQAPVAPAPVKQAPAPGAGVNYPNCAAVKAAGAAPLYAGQPGYSSKLDGDGDGVACEK